VGHDAVDLRLLQHHLGDEDPPGIPRVAPRQVAPVLLPPLQQAALEAGLDMLGRMKFAEYPTIGEIAVACALGYMDFRLTDPYLDSIGKYDDCYSERSLRLPDTFWCYDPHALELSRLPNPVDFPPALKSGAITFGCLNNFFKINEGILKLWAEVLRSTPHSRLLMLAPAGSARQWVAEELAHHGVAADRIDFVARQPHGKYLESFNRIDISLDTVPYNGHTTSLDSFWMGVPVVTRIGHTVVGRAGFSQLSNLGLTELAATSDEDFVRIAIELAGDVPRMAELRATLPERTLASPLCDATRFARNIESTYRQMWQQWCEE